MWNILPLIKFKKWKPRDCPCILCKVYINGVGLSCHKCTDIYCALVFYFILFHLVFLPNRQWTV